MKAFVTGEEERSDCDRALQESASRVLETAKSFDPRTDGILIFRFMRKKDGQGRTLRGIAYYPVGDVLSPSELRAMIKTTCLKE